MADAVLELGKSNLWVYLDCHNYAASGTPLLFTTWRAGMFRFNHTFALHRPKNGATATIPNATAKAIRIETSPLLVPESSKGSGGEPAVQPNAALSSFQRCFGRSANICNFAAVTHYPPREPA
jgi:hypothetical protein